LTKSLLHRTMILRGSSESKKGLTGSRIQLNGNSYEAAHDADIIYIDVWTSTVQEVEAEKRRLALSGYQLSGGQQSITPD